MGFLSLPDTARFRLLNATVPACLTSGDLARVAAGLKSDIVVCDIDIADGKILAIDAAGRLPATDVATSDVATCDLANGMVLPTFTDMHTHIDKGHIWPRASNPDGTFMGALTTVRADTVANWAEQDLRKRMDFSLRCAYAHGTRALRTHLDSRPPQHLISWPVLRDLRDEWRGRIDLQGSCLFGIDSVTTDGSFDEIADVVAAHGGSLGVVTFMLPDLQERLDVFFEAAEKRNLEVDLHVDETGDADAVALRMISETVLRRGFDAPVTVGHCCSLAVQEESDADRTMDLVAKAGINVVSLPMCNMYLQGRDAERTPRWRGVTLVHEMAARGIPISFASDNSRDPFYAYGDMDMIEVMREATRIAQLDHGRDDWAKAFTTTPSRSCGFDAQLMEAGAPGDFILCKARNFNELFSRPQSDRVVVRKGLAIDSTLPDYAELDELMEVS